MNRHPRLGEGVSVPWGEERAAGAVVAIEGEDRVVVAVSLGGAGQDVSDAIQSVFHLSELDELPPWRVVESRLGGAKTGADAPRAWWVRAVRGDEVDHAVVVEVRESGTLAASRRKPSDTKEAIATKGRSAVERFAHRYRLPGVIVLSTAGVVEGSDLN